MIQLSNGPQKAPPSTQRAPPEVLKAAANESPIQKPLQPDDTGPGGATGGLVVLAGSRVCREGKEDALAVIELKERVWAYSHVGEVGTSDAQRKRRERQVGRKVGR